MGWRKGVFRTGCLVVVFALGGGGQQLPPLNFSVPNVGPASKKIETEVKSITVTMGGPTR